MVSTIARFSADDPHGSVTDALAEAGCAVVVGATSDEARSAIRSELAEARRLAGFGMYGALGFHDPSVG